MASRVAPIDGQEQGRASGWRVFAVLMVVVLVLALVQIPYSASVMAERLRESDLPLGLWLAINAVLLPVGLAAVASGVGLSLGERVGLGAPLLRRWVGGDETARVDALSVVLPSALVGLATLGLLLALQLTILRLPADVAANAQPLARPPAWAGLLGSLYAGVFEEILLRLGFLTMLIWVGAKLTRARRVGPAVFWTANVIAAMLFGLGHLPSVAIFTPLTPFMLLRTLALNGIGGLVFGWLYWRKGILGAMVGHATSDLVQFLVVLPLLANR